MTNITCIHAEHVTMHGSRVSVDVVGTRKSDKTFLLFSCLKFCMIKITTLPGEEMSGWLTPRAKGQGHSIAEPPFVCDNQIGCLACDHRYRQFTHKYWQ